MTRFGIYREGPRITIEEHLARMDEPTKKMFHEIRSFVLSLGPDLIEEVRPHRIVYAKSIAFRTFLDIQPMKDMCMIEVKMGRGGTPESMVIRSGEELEILKEKIQQAYNRFQ